MPAASMTIVAKAMASPADAGSRRLVVVENIDENLTIGAPVSWQIDGRSHTYGHTAFVARTLPYATLRISSKLSCRHAIRRSGSGMASGSLFTAT